MCLFLLKSSNGLISFVVANRRHLNLLKKKKKSSPWWGRGFRRKSSLQGAYDNFGRAYYRVLRHLMCKRMCFSLEGAKSGSCARCSFIDLFSWYVGGNFHWFGMQPTSRAVSRVHTDTAVTPCNSPITPCYNPIIPSLAPPTGAYCTVSDDRVTQMVLDHSNSFKLSPLKVQGWRVEVRWVGFTWRLLVILRANIVLRSNENQVWYVNTGEIYELVWFLGPSWVLNNMAYAPPTVKYLGAAT